MIYCPDCREEIPAEDFNVSTDVAFCRRCGKNHRYSELAGFEIRAGFRPDPAAARHAGPAGRRNRGKGSFSGITAAWLLFFVSLPYSGAVLPEC